MSEREMRRAGVMARVASEELTVVDAAELVRVSYRQTKRLWKRYQEEGAAGMKHRRAGCRSNRAKPEKFRRRVLGLVRGGGYTGAPEKRFGPTLVAQELEKENGVHIDAETLRRWMLAEGLWSRQRKRAACRRRRDRREHFGELVQLDGSFHDWLEGRGPRGCLMVMVDDATSTVLCRLGEEETIWAAVGVLRAWIERYGVPLALYTDWKNVYKREPSEEELQEGKAVFTQFGRMCARLGIEILTANSPQAKGRVERSNGTHQDRLVKKMRRKKIATHEHANRFIEEDYLEEHNARFARPPVAAEDYHRAAPTACELRKIFRLETERVIGSDWVVRYEGRFFQVKPQRGRYAPARARVLVREAEDGNLEIDYRGRTLPFAELARQPVKEPAERRPSSGARHSSKPAADHPWRQYAGKREATRPAAAYRVAASASP